MITNSPGFNSIFHQFFSSKQPRVFFYKDDAQPPNREWRWTLWFSSDKVAASSEGYSSEALAKENFLKIEKHIEWLRTNGKI